MTIIQPGLASYGVAPVISTDDWGTRSAGAFFANRLSTSADLALYEQYDGPQVAASLDPSSNGDGSSGSIKFTVHPLDGTVSGTLLVPFGRSFWTGNEFWISVRVKHTMAHATQPILTGDGDFTGPKITIVGNVAESFVPYQTVVNLIDHVAQVNGFYQNGSAFVSWGHTSFTSRCAPGDFKGQPAIDNDPDGGVTLLGVNPDTGNAWTNCEHDAARFGGLYQRNKTITTRRGIGDWLSGGFKPFTEKWMTITQRVIVGTPGTPTSRWTVWVAPEGEDYITLYDDPNVSYGGTGPFNGIRVVAYYTERSTSGRHISSRTNNIPGVIIHNAGVSTPLGNGTLEYNATTQRFRWMSSANTVYGAVAGFSSANNKLFRAVQSASDRLTTTVTSNVYPPATGTFSIPVGSTTGFPNAGSVLVGGRTCEYTSKTATSFEGCTTVRTRPAGFRVRTDPATANAYLTSEVTVPTTSINVDSTAGWPSTGQIYGLPANSYPYGVVRYTSKTATQLLGITGTGVFLGSGWPVRTEDYLIIEVVPEDLPTTGTVTDTVTIAEYRAAASVNVRDLIMSESPIPAPSAVVIPPSPTAPAWVPSTPWTFQEIPGTTWMSYLKDNGTGIADAVGGSVGYGEHASYRNLTDDGGLCYSPKHKELYISRGGHAACSSNILARFNLGKDAPDMTVCVQSTPYATRLADYQDSQHITTNHGYHSDGRPYAAHGWRSNLFVDSIDEYIEPALTGTVTQVITRQTQSWHRGDSAWRQFGYWEEFPLTSGDQWMTGFLNYARDTLYVLRSYSYPLRKLDVNTRTWSNVGGNNLDGHICSASANPSGTVLVLGSRAPTTPTPYQAHFINISTGARVSVMTTGYPHPGKNIYGLEWIPSLNGWIGLYAQKYAPPGPVPWQLLLFQQQSSDSVLVTNILVQNAPNMTVERSWMWYDQDYNALIFGGEPYGAGNLRVVKVGSV